MVKYQINHELLKERVIKKFGTEKSFYEFLGISKQAYYYKLRAKNLSIQSLVEIANALGITQNQFKDYFLVKE